MKIEFITVERSENKDGKRVGLSINVDGHIYGINTPVPDYDKVQKSQVVDMLRGLAAMIEQEEG